MSRKVSCPQCAQPVNPKARYCEQCGVDLALAAVMAERTVISPAHVGEVPLSPEILVPRIGDSMVDQGFLTAEQLQEALDFQHQENEKGRQILIGQAMIELGFISREILDSIVTERILQLQTALQLLNRQLEVRVQERTQELQRALQRLGELNQLKSNFIANISHELRTPLTHIKGYLDLLVEKSLGPLTPPQADALAVIQRAENRLEHLIEDLIQFSLASRGELSLNVKPVSLAEVFRVVAEGSRNMAARKSIKLVVTLPENLPQVLADHEKIRWVLSQLLDNALKFTPENGTIRLTAELDGGLVNISVEDTGIGIPEERIEEVFESFHQLDGSPTRRYGGTGLGLAMVRNIIEGHGSQIKVKSKLGEGTHLVFQLFVANRANVQVRTLESTGVD